MLWGEGWYPVPTPLKRKQKTDYDRVYFLSLKESLIAFIFPFRERVLVIFFRLASMISLRGY